MDDRDLFVEVMGSISTCKFAIFACRHDNSTNISRIGPKLIPWMYPILDVSWLSSKMDDRDLFFEVMGGRFQLENLQFSLVSTIAQHILVALDTNLYHRSVLAPATSIVTYPIRPPGPLVRLHDSYLRG